MTSILFVVTSKYYHLNMLHSLYTYVLMRLKYLVFGYCREMNSEEKIVAMDTIQVSDVESQLL